MIELKSLGKLDLLQQTIKNWPMVIADNFHLLQREYVCHLENGGFIRCRPRTTDAGVTVAVCSGYEYPAYTVSVPDRSVVFDLGTNIGTFIAYLKAENVQKSLIIHAFEPARDNFSILQSNVQINDWTEIYIHQAAIAAQSGTVYLDPMEQKMDGIRIEKSEENGIPVTAYNLPSYCRENHISHIDLIKMDIEGEEYAVLKNDWEWFRNNVDKMLVEFHETESLSSMAEPPEYIKDNFKITPIWERDTTGVFFLENRKLI